MCNIKVYGRTILFCVHVSPVIRDGHMNPEEDVKTGILSGRFPFAGRGEFYVFIDFLRKEIKSFPNPNLTSLPSVDNRPPPLPIFYNCREIYSPMNIFVYFY